MTLAELFSLEDTDNEDKVLFQRLTALNYFTCTFLCKFYRQLHKNNSCVYLYFKASHMSFVLTSSLG